MKITLLRTEQNLSSFNDRSLRIQTYGEKNDYPQRIMEIVSQSGTGKSCMNIYSKFIAGRGFSSSTLSESILNKRKQTGNYLLNQLAGDFAKFGGFCLHVNYNMLCEVVSIHHVAFETVRFTQLDDNGNFDKVAIHPDWGRRNIKLRKWSQSDIDYIDLFNPDPEVITAQTDKAGGWNSYKGQILYYSSAGEKVYPTPIFEPVLADMNTEEGISNIKNRNARNNFLPAGMIVDYDNSDESEQQKNETQTSLEEFQTDYNTGKLIYIQTQSPEHKPEFIPFKANNYDRDFEITEKTIVQNIGRSFFQPPILRAEDVGSNFGSELMKNAYNFYNSITENERQIVERVMKQVLSIWHDPSLNQEQDFTILPCRYQVEPDYNNIPSEILNDLSANERRELIGYDNKEIKQEP